MTEEDESFSRLILAEISAEARGMGDCLLTDHRSAHSLHAGCPSGLKASHPYLMSELGSSFLPFLANLDKRIHSSKIPIDDMSMSVPTLGEYEPLHNHTLPNM